MHDYAKGQDVETIILGIEPERERISLGVKQLEQNPFGQYQEAHAKGSLTSGKVTEVEAKRVTVDLGDGIQGMIKAAEIAVEKVKDANDYVKVGEEVEAKIISFDNKNTVVMLSIKAMHESTSASKAKGSKSTESPISATLGDLLKEQMENKED